MNQNLEKERVMTQERLKTLLCYDPVTGLFTWRATVRPYLHGKRAGHCQGGYVWIIKDGFRYLAHRLAWLYVYGQWPAKFLDHINGVRNDNRIDNLREADHLFNCQNRHGAQKNNALGIAGVSAVRRGYVARITVGGHTTNLGQYSDPQQAHAAYLAAKRRLHAGCTS